MRRFVIAAIFMSLAFTGVSKDFRYLRTQEGLNDGKINSITQDSTGNIWIGTYSGLTKYDGTVLKEFRPELGNPGSLPSKKIKKLLVDSNDNLWVASNRNLCLFDKRKDTFIPVLFLRDKLSALDIWYLSEFKETLIVHTIEGFYSIPLEQVNNGNIVAHKVKFSKTERTDVNFIYTKSTQKQLYLVSEVQPNVSEIYIADYVANDQDSLLNLRFVGTLNSHVNEIEYSFEKDVLYFATSDGLIPFVCESQNFASEIYFKGKDVKNVVYTENNKLFCSIPGPSLLYVDLHTGLTGNYLVNTNEDGSLLNNEILTLFEDFSGNLWIGHQGQGISILNLYPKAFITFSRDPLNNNSLSSNVVTSFSESEAEYLIGCRNNGLNIITKKDLFEKNPKFKHVNIPDDNNPQGYGVWSIAKQSEHIYWLATEQGLFKMIKSNNDWKVKAFQGNPIIKDLVWKLLIDANGNIWCGTFKEGLILIPNPDRNPEYKYFTYQNEFNDSTSLSDNYVKELMIDSKNRFWVGTLNGLNCLEGDYRDLDLSGRKKPKLIFKRYLAENENDNGLKNSEINGLKENINGNIWISTNGGGINILNPESGRFSYLTMEEGMPTDDIYGMMSDEYGNVWISTLRGLVSYNQLQDEPQLSIYDQYDGIQGDVFIVGSNYKSNDGVMFFGGNNGFTCFEPSKIKVNRIKPKVALADLFFQNKRIGVGDTIKDNGFVLQSSLNYIDKIVMPFEKNYFRIRVSTLHFQSPSKNIFKYTLEGYMRRWSIKSNNDEVVFGNLPYGEYTLKVKALSSDYIESDNTKILTIEIQPPWYKRWYSIMIFILLILSVVIGFLYILINRQKLIYQRQLDEMTIKNNENKMLFLTNIAHEIRTPLSLIIAPIEDMIQDISKEEVKWKDHLQLIHRNSAYLLKLTNQIIDFRKLNAGKTKLKLEKTDVVRLIKDVVLNFRGYGSKRNIKLYLNTPIERIHAFIDAQKIEEVLYNLLSNAFKNTFENHAITVSLDFVDKDSQFNNQRFLRFSVFNEGEELSDEDKTRIFERFYKVNENAEGAGIGLSFSKSLVELHNGILKVESIHNKGVVFHVYLPANNIELSAKEVEELNFEHKVIQVPVNGKEQIIESNLAEKFKVLIIEDNSELRDFLNIVLSKQYQCIFAGDGAEGWKIVKKELPSLIISDVIMPNMNGYELCNLIKKTKETCHIPVVLLTAKNTDENQVEGYMHGADAYIIKPFDVKVLLTQVSRLIKNRELIKEKYLENNFMVEVRSSLPKDKEFLQNLRKLLEDNITDPDFNVTRISEHLNISTTQLYRRMKQLTGHSPVEFIKIVKLQKAYGYLSQNDKTVKEVCYLIGFNSLSYFIKCFKEQFGVTPANFRDKGVVVE